MRARHVARVTRDDVGQRVTVRRWLDEIDGEVGDVVGHLVTWSEDDVLTIRRRDETEVDVPASSVLASRVIPDPPPRPVR